MRPKEMKDHLADRRHANEIDVVRDQNQEIASARDVKEKKNVKNQDLNLNHLLIFNLIESRI